MRTAKRLLSWVAWLVLLLPGCGAADAEPEKRWKAHVIASDPDGDGPDGVTIGDFDGDGLPDLLVPFEQGGYTRLYLHPGYESDLAGWKVVQFPHGGEDAGAGDLDMDGHLDVVVNGGHVFFNPGPEKAADVEAWRPMTLRDDETARVPFVVDLDGDGHNDLVARGVDFYRAPSAGKREAANWKRHQLGDTAGPMNAIPADLDEDGDLDILVADRRGGGLVWFEQPDGDPFVPWRRRIIDPANDIRFIKLVDIDGDGRSDIVVSHRNGGNRVLVYLRRNEAGAPVYGTVAIEPPADAPKGINAHDYDGDGRMEIFVLAKGRGEWMARHSGNPARAEDWTTSHLRIDGYKKRRKMDDAINLDVDGDGDMDVLTTEETRGWGVIWFENPWNPADAKPIPVP